jgi:hypothetical protein
MTRNRLIQLTVVLWAVLFVLSFVLYFLLEPTGDGFTRGTNRITAFATWQGIAVAVAIVAWMLGRGIRSAGPRSRWLSRTPAIVHSVMILLAIAWVLILLNASPPIETIAPPGPVTAPSPDAALRAEPPTVTRQFAGIFRDGFEARHL